jgi:hypothetical protein
MGFFRVGELDEPVALGQLGGSISDDLGTESRSILAPKKLQQLMLSSRNIDVPHINLHLLTQFGLSLCTPVGCPVELKLLVGVGDAAVVVVEVEVVGGLVG